MENSALPYGGKGQTPLCLSRGAGNWIFKFGAQGGSQGWLIERCSKSSLRSRGRRVRQKREGAPHLTLGKGDGAAVAGEVGWRGREGGLRWHRRSLAEKGQGLQQGLWKDGDHRDLNKAVAGP